MLRFLGRDLAIAKPVAAPLPPGAAIAKPGSSPAPLPAAAAPDAADETRERRAPVDLVCATCGRRITHDDHRIAVAGAHAHTFVNPGGFVHHLGCFAVATGLSFRGATETAFSWFPGFSWQLSHCATCAIHLGWIYRCAGDSFHGLLFDRLVVR